MSELAEQSGRSVAEIKSDVKALAEEYQRQGVNVPLSWKRAYDEMGVYSENAEKKMRRNSQETSESMQDDAEEIGEEHKESSRKASEAWGKAFSSIGKVASTGIKAISTGVGVAVTGLTALGVSSTNTFAEYEQLVGGAELMFGDAYSYIAEKSANAFQTVQMSQNEYLTQVNGFATGLKTALGGNEQAAAELADKIITAEADIVAATGNTAENVQNAFNGIMKSNYTMLDNLQIGITPTKEGMQEVIDKVNKWNATQGKVTKYTIKNVADCQSALIDYIDMVGMSGYANAEAAGTISGSLAMTKAAWSNLLVGLADDTQNFDTLINNFVKSATIAFENLLPRVETTISGIGNLIESVFPIIVDRIPQILNDVVPDLLQSGINMITALLTGIQQNLPQILNAGVELLGIFASGILSMLPILADTTLEIISTLYTLLTDNLPVMLERGYEMLRSLVDGIISAIPEMLPKALDFVQQLATNIAEKAPEFLQKGFELLSMLVDGIILAIPILIEKVPLIVSTFANVINDNFPTILAKGVELLLKFIQGIISTIPTLVANIPKIISAIVDVFMAYNWINLGKTIITGFKNGITNMVSQVKDAGTKIFNTVKNAIKDLPTTLKSLANNGFQGFANAITGLKSTAANAAKAIFNAVKDNVLNLPSTLKGIGKDLVTGLWNGITNKTSWLTSKIASFAKDVVKSAKKALGINSPSKEFAYLGDMCVAGFEQPMEEFNPYKTLQNSMEANIGGLKATFAKTSAQSGNSFAFDYGQFGQEVKSSIQGVGVYLNGEKVGQLITPTINNELSTYSLRRI